MGDRGFEGVVSNIVQQQQAAVFDVPTLFGNGPKNIPQIDAQALENVGQDSVLQSMANYRVARLAMVTADGVRYLPQGFANAVEYNLDHPGEMALKVGVAAGLGLAMRALLPKAGAAKALAGTIMGAFFLKDAAKPVVQGWADVWDNKSLANLDRAGQRMGDGLGMFAFDSALTLPVGMLADKAAGMTLTKTSWGRSFELGKENFYNSDASAVGRFFNWSTRTADNTSTYLSQRLMGSAPHETLTIDQKLALIADAQRSHLTDAQAARAGTIDDAFKAQLETQRRYRMDMPDTIEGLMADVPVGEQAKFGLTNKGLETRTATTATQLAAAELEAGLVAKPGQMGQGQGLSPARFVDEGAGTGGAGRGTETTGGDAPGTGTGGKGTPVDKPPVVAEPQAPPLPTGPKVALDVRDVGNMASAVRERAGQVTESDMAIADLREGWQSSMRATTLEPPGPPKLPLLDRGHFENNKNLIELADQIRTPEQVKEAGFLMEHFRVANQQLVLNEKLPEIVDLNNYSRSVHNKLMELLVKNGVKPEEVLRGTNSPMFLIFDSRAAGPYTIPAIKGVTDTPVVVLPREYQNMLGVHVAGVYPHELGHDLIYGDLLRFPETLRNKVLTEDVVSAGMKQAGIPDVPVNVPGHGLMQKSELFVRLLQAQANENTADWFGTAIDPNTGLSLAVLLGSLRKPLPGAPAGAAGALETRSMYGSEFADPTNPLGIEPHGIDRWRLKSTAQVLREMSGGDKAILERATNMDRLAEQMARPGETYAWANMDKPGEYFAIPQKEWDAIIPAIVKAQLDTPLDALNGRTLRQVFPDMRQTFPRVDALADQMAAAALEGRPTVMGTFDKSAHRIEDVFSAGLSAWAKAMEKNPAAGEKGHIAPDQLISNINAISESLRAQYRGDAPMPIPGLTTPGKVDFATAFKKPSYFVQQYLGKAVEAQPQIRETVGNWEPFFSRYVGTQLGLAFSGEDVRRQRAAKFGFTIDDHSATITPPPGSETQPKQRGN
ncbi:MAG: hypothetical protein U0105_24650 [Candidatus Obscuribacterales bacterium]